MKALIAILALLAVLLQFKLWFGDGSIMEMSRLEKSVAAQADENAQLRERNQALAAEVPSLCVDRSCAREYPRDKS